MRRSLYSGLVLLAGTVSLMAATLERLSLDDMIAQSTAIQRAKVTGSSATYHGPAIYTHYKLQVTESWKGDAITDVMVPGGTANGVTQSVAGAPALRTGKEYVLFLWKGPSGNTQVLGLTQGLFTLPGDNSTDPTATRTPSTELMIDRVTGQSVKEEKLSLKLSELKSKVKAQVGK